MATVLVIGPSQAGWNEPAPAPPLPAGHVPVIFGDPAITLGGNVHLVFGPVDPATTPAYPLLVHAIYIPTGQETALVAAADAAAFLASTFPQAVAPWTDTTKGLTVAVPGVTPGLFHVQTILEYSA